MDKPSELFIAGHSTNDSLPGTELEEPRVTQPVLDIVIGLPAVATLLKLGISLIIEKHCMTSRGLRFVFYPSFSL